MASGTIENLKFKAVAVNEINKGKGMSVSPTAQKVIDFINNELPSGMVISTKNLCDHLNISHCAVKYALKRNLSDYYRKSSIDRSLYFGRPDDVKKIK